MENLTRLNFTVTRDLYESSFGDVTVTLEPLVLFLYVATDPVHISIYHLLGHKLEQNGLGMLGEFRVVAPESHTRNSELDTTGGIEVSKALQAPVSVKELQDENLMGTVVEEPSFPDAEDGSPSKMRPDWKYS